MAACLRSASAASWRAGHGQGARHVIFSLLRLCRRAWGGSYRSFEIEVAIASHQSRDLTDTNGCWLCWVARLTGVDTDSESLTRSGLGICDNHCHMCSPHPWPRTSLQSGQPGLTSAPPATAHLASQISSRALTTAASFWGSQEHGGPWSAYNSALGTKWLQRASSLGSLEIFLNKFCNNHVQTDLRAAPQKRDSMLTTTSSHAPLSTCSSYHLALIKLIAQCKCSNTC